MGGLGWEGPVCEVYPPVVSLVFPALVVVVAERLWGEAVPVGVDCEGVCRVPGRVLGDLYALRYVGVVSVRDVYMQDSWCVSVGGCWRGRGVEDAVEDFRFDLFIRGKGGGEMNGRCLPPDDE